jgi:hypothetical protein
MPKRTTTKKPSRVERIMAAQQRVTLAQEWLSKLPPTDDRFIDALNEYRDAIEARNLAEKRKS